MKNLFYSRCKNNHSVEYRTVIFDFISEKNEAYLYLI